MGTIIQLDESTYETVFRGRVYTLVKNAEGWSMWNKPINGRANPPKPFNNIMAVEAKYKHWVGISQLVSL